MRLLLVVLALITISHAQIGPNARQYVRCACRASARGFSMSTLDELRQALRDIDEERRDLLESSLTDPDITPASIETEILIQAADHWEHCVNNFSHEECVNADTSLRIRASRRSTTFCFYDNDRRVECSKVPMLASTDSDIISGRPEIRYTPPAPPKPTPTPKPAAPAPEPAPPAPKPAATAPKPAPLASKPAPEPAPPAPEPAPPAPEPAPPASEPASEPAPEPAPPAPKPVPPVANPAPPADKPEPVDTSKPEPKPRAPDGAATNPPAVSAPKQPIEAEDDVQSRAPVRTPMPGVTPASAPLPVSDTDADLAPELSVSEAPEDPGSEGLSTAPICVSTEWLRANSLAHATLHNGSSTNVICFPGLPCGTPGHLLRTRKGKLVAYREACKTRLDCVESVMKVSQLSHNFDWSQFGSDDGELFLTSLSAHPDAKGRGFSWYLAIVADCLNGAGLGWVTDGIAMIPLRLRQFEKYALDSLTSQK